MSIHTIDFIGEGSNSPVSMNSKISSSDLRKQKLGCYRLPKVLYYYDNVCDKRLTYDIDQPMFVSMGLEDNTLSYWSNRWNSKWKDLYLKEIN